MNSFLDISVLDALVVKVIAFIGALTPLVTWLYGLWEKKRKRRPVNVDAMLKELPIADETKREVILQWRSKDRLIFGLLSSLLVVGVLAAWVAWSIYSRTPSQADVSLLLSKYDPALFGSARTKSYSFARVFSDHSDLSTNSDIAGDIDGAMKEFNLVARHAKSILEQYQNVMLTAIQRGVTIRVIVMDDTKKGDFLAMHARETQRKPEQVQARISESVVLAKKMAAIIRSDKAKYRGSLELKKWNGFLLHSVWLRDPMDDGSALANLGLYTHRGFPHNPAFRVSRRTSAKLIEESRIEFEKLWVEASAVVKSD